MVSALRTFKGKHFRSGAATASLIDQLYAVLMALGTESAFNAVKLLFFFFEIVNISKNRSCQNNNEEE